MDERDRKELVRAAAKQILVYCLLLLVQMVIFFISAGHTSLPRAWVFFGITFAYLVGSVAVLYRFNPELMKQRLKMRRAGSKSWDEVLMRAINLTAMCVVPAVAGLDVGRFHWSSLGIQFIVVGFVLYVLGSVLPNWAIVVNPHFEQTVRIQKDRGHKVITTGPYSFVRHPGYLGGILWTLSIPFIIGSLFAFAPVGIYSFLTMIRTSLEDRTLMRELNGYSDYAKRVRYRLFPGIW